MIIILPGMCACSDQRKLISPKEAEQLYHAIPGAERINKTAFTKSVSKFRTFEGAKNYNLLTIVDFSRPSTKERLFVIDLKKKTILLSSLCSHGINSGELYAVDFFGFCPTISAGTA